MKSHLQLSRRDFLRATAVASAAVLAGGENLLGAAAPVAPVAVFSKIYQELSLSLEESVQVTVAAGLDGLDCPVRPGGQIEPDRAKDELPRLAHMAKDKGLSLPLLTTAITSVASPHTEELLRAAKQAGVRFFRFGYTKVTQDTPVRSQLAEVRSKLKDLAALNGELGLCGIYQNHSPGGARGYLGGIVSELAELVEGFPPDQIGVAFDIGHAIVVHGEKWRAEFERIRSHFRVAYIKDPGKGGGWVPFGQGWIRDTDYFKMLKQCNYSAPYSLHIEFDWSRGGQEKTKAALITALRSSVDTLRGWARAAAGQP
jgi:sugar phosphate isomerase/epimerase